MEIAESFVVNTRRSEEAYIEASKLMPGGSSATGRYYKPYPLTIVSGKGSKIYDLDNNEFVDYFMSFGALLLGHGHPSVTRVLHEQIDRGVFYGIPNQPELDLARKIVAHCSCVDMVRFANSGSEGVMHALRVARAYTGKDKIAKCEGGYHGNFDQVLISVTPVVPAGSSSRPQAVPHGAGIPRNTADNLIILPFNDPDAAVKLIEENARDLAAVIVEPVQGYAGMIPATKEFLQALREVTTRLGIVLIFDEVITGFRLALGGAAEYFGIIPDMVAMGKIMGGGLPVGAYGGKREIMQKLVPTRDPKIDLTKRAYQSGTFNGHPMVMAAGTATIEELERLGTYENLFRHSDEAKRGLAEILSDAGHDIQITGPGPIFNVHFVDRPINNVRDAMLADFAKFDAFVTGLIGQGVFLEVIPCHFCLTTAHTKEDVDKLLEAAKTVSIKLER